MRSLADCVRLSTPLWTCRSGHLISYHSYLTGQYKSGDEQQSHMATAATTEAGELVYADRVDPSAGPFYCIGCAESHEVSYVKSHLRELGDDSTTVSPHFRHPSNTGGSGSAGGPAESDTHRRRKIEALGVAMIRYDYAEADLETPINGKRPDGYLEFEFPDERFGRGFAIEYQHRNESKDIEASADAFVAEEFTTLVLTAEQFPDDMAGVPNIDLLGGRVITPFPRGLPDDAHEFETSWDARATRGPNLTGLRESRRIPRISFSQGDSIWSRGLPRITRPSSNGPVVPATIQGNSILAQTQRC